MNWIELVRHYFPDVTDEQADFILWEYTGFPAFWDINKCYPTPAARCRKQLRELKYRLIRQRGEVTKEEQERKRKLAERAGFKFHSYEVYEYEHKDTRTEDPYWTNPKGQRCRNFPDFPQSIDEEKFYD